MKFFSAFKLFRRPFSVLSGAVRDFGNHEDRTARRSLEIVHAIAADIVGSETFEIESAFLSGRTPKGSSSPLAKLYMHTVVKPDGSRWGIIERRSNSLRELSAYQHAADSGNALLPRVYRIQRHSRLSLFEFRHHVYIELLPKTGFSAPSDATAARLAAQMVKIADIPMAPSIRAVRRNPGDLTRAFLKVVAEDRTLLSSAGDDLMSALPTLSQTLCDRAVLAAPLVTCHNDLHAKNVGQRDDGSMAFFDWEQVGPNHLGSDLHHFMASGLARSKEWGRFATVLCDEYAKHAEESFGVPRQAIAVAANTFCIIKGMNRAVRHRKPATTLAVLKYLDRVRLGGLEAFPDFGASAAQRFAAGGQPMPGMASARV